MARAPESSVLSPGSFNLSLLRASLHPFHLHWFPRLGSTNGHAAALRKRGKLFAPAIVLTGRQIAGRGRGGNVWWSDDSALTVTFVFPAEETLPAGELPLIAGLAVRNAAAELTGDQSIQLKWPNDVLFNGRKLAGLLCERLNKVDLIGVGMNINLDPRDAPAELKRLVTSLRAIAKKPLDRSQALIVVASHLRQLIQSRLRQPFGHFQREYEKHHALLGRRVAIVNENSPRITGRVEGIDSQGRLLLREKTHLHHIVAGHVVQL